MINNILKLTDSYKVSQHKQYPPGTEHVYSYLESRGGMFPETVFFGLEYILRNMFCGQVVTEGMINKAREFYAKHFGRDDVFNYNGWMHILEYHNGHLPIKIKAVPEGTVASTSNVLMTIENTDPAVPWLTTWLETILLQIWYPLTVCTLSREIKKVIHNYLVETGTPESINFRLHDFGYRGVSSLESAALGGAAHLINFLGTDTIAGISLLQDYYDADVCGFSVPAMEHSTVTSWGKDGEPASFRNMLEQYPTGIIACVSDSYDIFNACDNIWGQQLKELVENRDGVLVIRPDSGDPKTVVIKCLEILGNRFGVITNEKGYKVLNPKVRLIQGDGVNYDSIRDILQAMKERGWSADNITFGCGGALLQKVDRDTQKMAIKCSSVTIGGEQRDVFKDPITDNGKSSKRGRLALVNGPNGPMTVPEHKAGDFGGDLLQTVFLDGYYVGPVQSLEDIRKRASI